MRMIWGFGGAKFSQPDNELYTKNIPERNRHNVGRRGSHRHGLRAAGKASRSFMAIAYICASGYSISI